MAPESSIDDLRRRLRKDPASIAFAQLAEELRRAGHHADAVAVAQTGLAIYPEYLSARVTLGRSLIELARLDDAQRELETVLATAPEHLAATRGLADIHHRRQPSPAALRAARTVVALEAWLTAINVTRAHPSA